MKSVHHAKLDDCFAVNTAKFIQLFSKAFLELAEKRSWLTWHRWCVRTIEISIGVSASWSSNQLAANVSIELTQARCVCR